VIRAAASAGSAEPDGNGAGVDLAAGEEEKGTDFHPHLGLDNGIGTDAGRLLPERLVRPGVIRGGKALDSSEAIVVHIQDGQLDIGPGNLLG